MKQLVFVVIFFFAVPSFFGQSTPIQTPTPGVAASEKFAAKTTGSISEPTPTPEDINPSEVDEPFKPGWTFSGGVDFVSIYHGSNGQKFGGTDQNYYFDAEYKFNPNFSIYTGTWYAAQFKELDYKLGTRFGTGRFDHEAQWQLLYFADGKVSVHQLSYEVSTSVYESKRFNASVYGRAEYYFTRAKDDLTPGAYFIGGINTDTRVGDKNTLSLGSKFVRDNNGAFNTQKANICFVNGSFIRDMGKFRIGPMFTFSVGNKSDRPKLFSFGLSLSF